MAKEKEINEGQLTPEIVDPKRDFAEARWSALSQFGLDKPSGDLVRDLQSDKKVLLQRGVTITRALSAPDLGPGVIQFIASTDGQKRDGNRVRNSGWHFENFSKNPVFLWCHDYRSLPIGRHVDWRVEKEKDGYVLRIWSQFCDPEIYAFADKIRKMYEAGFLRAGSIGWNPIKFEIMRDRDGQFAGFDFVENDLLEFSAVPVPSDPDAIVEAISRGIIGSNDIERIQEYGQLPKLSRGVAYTLSNFDILPPSTMTPETKVRTSVVTEEDPQIEEFMDQAAQMEEASEQRVVPDATNLSPVEESKGEPIVSPLSHGVAEDPTTSVAVVEEGLVIVDALDEDERDCRLIAERSESEDLLEYDKVLFQVETDTDPEDDEEDDGGEDEELEDISEVISEAFSEAAEKVSQAVLQMLKTKHEIGDSEHASLDHSIETRAKTNFPKRGDDQSVTLRNSNYPQFDREFAEKLKKDYPKIWRSGGNIYGNTAYRLWGECRSNGGSPSTKEQEKWIRKREAWTARHFEDGRQFKGGKTEPNVSNVAGIVAQIKWGSIGTLGEGEMKDVIRIVMKKLDEKRAIEDVSEVRVGKKMSSKRMEKMVKMREAMDNAKGHMGTASDFLEQIMDELIKAEEKANEDVHENSPKDKNVYSIDEQDIVTAMSDEPADMTEHTVAEEGTTDNVTALDGSMNELVRLSSRLNEIENILLGRSQQVEDKAEDSPSVEPLTDEFEARLLRIREAMETIPTQVKPNTTKPKSEYVQSVLEKIGLLRS